MSMSIEELSSLYGTYGINGLSQVNSQSVSSSETEKKATDGDSYISTIAGMDLNAAIPSENYNDLARMVKSASASSANSNATEYESVENSTDADTESVGGAGGSGGGSSSDSDEETETEIVTINGRMYLQTTTTDSEGNKTVTRTSVGSAPADGAKGVGSEPSAAAQALAAM